MLTFAFSEAGGMEQVSMRGFGGRMSQAAFGDFIKQVKQLSQSSQYWMRKYS